jgi:hypothetical protein
MEMFGPAATSVSEAFGRGPSPATCDAVRLLVHKKYLEIHKRDYRECRVDSPRSMIADSVVVLA